MGGEWQVRGIWSYPKAHDNVYFMIVVFVFLFKICPNPQWGNGVGRQPISLQETSSHTIGPSPSLLKYQFWPLSTPRGVQGEGDPVPFYSQSPRINHWLSLRGSSLQILKYQFFPNITHGGGHGGVWWCLVLPASSIPPRQPSAFFFRAYNLGWHISISITMDIQKGILGWPIKLDVYPSKLM